MAAEQKVADEKEPLGLRLSLKLKLTLLITTLLVLTVLLVSVFLVRQQQESLTNEMSKRGRTIARDLGERVEEPDPLERRPDAVPAGAGRHEGSRTSST